MYLQRKVLTHNQPTAVKNVTLSETLHLRPASVVKALNTLVSRGYLLEHDRGERGARSFSLAWTVAKTT